MNSIPSLEKLVEQAERLPNQTLEKVFRESAKGGIQRFGKRVQIPEEVLNYIRIVLNERSENGQYVFASRSEKRKLRTIPLYLPEEEGWRPTSISKETQTWLRNREKKRANKGGDLN